MIVVMPDYNCGAAEPNTACLDIPDGPQVETYLRRDVIGTVDRDLRTIADRSGRAIGGHSGGIRSDVSFTDGNRFGNQAAVRQDNVPALYMGTVPLPRDFALFVDVGGDDAEALRDSRELFDAIHRRGLPIDFAVVPGAGHDWRLWSRQIRASRCPGCRTIWRSPGAAENSLRSSATVLATVTTMRHPGSSGQPG